MLNKKFVSQISDEALAALKKVAKAHGLTVTGGGGSFSDTDATLRFKFTAPNAPTRDEKIAENFKNGATLFGLKPEHFGAEFFVKGTVYKIVGLAPNRPKFPIIAERVKDGKKFKFPVSVKTLLGV